MTATQDLTAPVALTTRPHDRHTTAVHEAAHAVAALRTGTLFTDVLLDPPLDPACLGILTYPRAPTVHALAVVLCAGLVVELRAGHPITHGDGCDLEELLQLAPDFARETGLPVMEALIDAFEESRRILRRQHAAVHRVTDALLEEGRLSYDDVRRIAQLPGTVPGGAQTAITTGRR